MIIPKCKCVSVLMLHILLVLNHNLNYINHYHFWFSVAFHIYMTSLIYDNWRK